MSSISPNADAAPNSSPQYVVVARRYRPQTFGELIGQEHVAQALSNAITNHRVGHAYLFTGARGVGKTSTARILAKALNCQHGPSPIPCNECDICQSIGTGEDVDVLEIDGASNRGIDEIRQLRQNVNVRPSRSRYKIYIIDEVHMLTREAFNALLKTLEEPPEHVKFIFCTTEATKIPITILSRCQRFDFAGILTQSICKRLQQIVEAEGVEAEREALEVLARRAAGSMRDSQSLLEQLLAFAPGKITVADVHGMLGTAGEERIAALMGGLIDRNPAASLAELDAAMSAGVDAPQLIEQLFGYLRDCMVATVGCPSDTFLYTSPSGAARVVEVGQTLGLDTLLAIMQILDQTLSRMRYSTQGRILAELALVRIAHLENLGDLASLIAQLQSGGGVELVASSRPVVGVAAAALSGAAKKKLEPPLDPPPQNEDDAQPSGVSQLALTAENAAQVWNLALSQMSGMMVDQARQSDSIAISAPNRLVIRFKPEYALFKTACERPEQLVKFERALTDVTGQRIRVEFALAEGKSAQPEKPVAPVRAVSPHLRLLEAGQLPFVLRATELFGAQPTRIDEAPPPKE